MKKIFKEPLFYLVLILAFGLGVMVWNFVLAQQANWSEPTAAFPSGQVWPPIDQSATPQTKTGDLGTNGNLNVGQTAAVGALTINGLSDPNYIPKVSFSSSNISYGINGICLPDVAGGNVTCKDNWAAIGTGGGGGGYWSKNVVTIAGSSNVINYLKPAANDKVIIGGDPVPSNIGPGQRKPLEPLRIAEEIGISTTAVENNIKKLKGKKILKRIGSARSG